MSRRTLARLALVSCLSLLAGGAHAQLFRTYLSSTGSDANACTLLAPCRLLPAALNAVASGGEIWMLDSANYNGATVTIAKSVTIVAIPGAVGSVVATGGPALSIAASGLTIALRNVVIAPLPGTGGTHGISMTGASALTLENSLIANLPINGVLIVGTGRIEIANTTIRNNVGFGVRLEAGASAVISSSKMLNNTAGGVLAYSQTASTTTATISDSIFSGGNEGVYALSTVAGSVAGISVTRCTIQNTLYALDSQTGNTSVAVVAVSNSMVTKNTYPFYQAGTGSVVRTLGNNHITDNSSSGIGALTLSSLQ